MMPGILRMVAVLLVVSVAIALPGAHTLTFPADVIPANRIPANPAQHPAGCHGYKPAMPSPPPLPSPSPGPVSYECCASGHQAAIPNPTFSTCPLADLVSGLDRGVEFSPLSVARVYRPLSVVPSNSPPDGAPLRI
jgi:hypothetical protein